MYLKYKRRKKYLSYWHVNKVKGDNYDMNDMSSLYIGKLPGVILQLLLYLK